MTDQEKRSLRCYLKNCLEPAMLAHHDALTRWSENAKTADNQYTLATAKMMYQYSLGKVQAVTAAIADFKEMFAEELATVED